MSETANARLGNRPASGQKKTADGWVLEQFREVLPFLRPYRSRIAAAAVVLTVTAALALAMPLIAGDLVDSFNPLSEDSSDRLFVVALAIAALLAFGSGIRYALGNDDW